MLLKSFVQHGHEYSFHLWWSCTLFLGCFLEPFIYIGGVFLNVIRKRSSAVVGWLFDVVVTHFFHEVYNLRGSLFIWNAQLFVCLYHLSAQICHGFFLDFQISIDGVAVLEDNFGICDNFSDFLSMNEIVLFEYVLTELLHCIFNLPRVILLDFLLNEFNDSAEFTGALFHILDDLVNGFRQHLRFI